MIIQGREVRSNHVIGIDADCLKRHKKVRLKSIVHLIVSSLEEVRQLETVLCAERVAGWGGPAGTAGTLLALWSCLWVFPELYSFSHYYGINVYLHAEIATHTHTHTHTHTQGHGYTITKCCRQTLYQAQVYHSVCVFFSSPISSYIQLKLGGSNFVEKLLQSR